MAQKKNTQRRSTSKQRSNTQKKNTKARGGAEKTAEGLNPQTKAILLLLSAVLLMALVIFPGESLWSGVRGFMYGVF